MQPGSKLAHFEIIRKLGEGGMGEVYLARDEKLHREVALKVLHEDYFDSEHRRDRFQREATMAARVSHSNVTAIYDIGTAKIPESDEEISYIVMEFVEGQSLKDFMRGKQRDLATMLRVAEKIASGIAAAHKLNVVHRDLKPENIIVDADGEPKILDFGLAKAVAAIEGDGEKAEGEGDTISQELTRAGTVVGTVSYMSPEQAQGKDVDSRSDVFSFGILLYNMFTGELPFTGKTQVSILARILEKQPEKPSLKNESIPPELERIIDKCLQKDPNERYQDTRDLVVDLRRLRREYDSGVTETVTGATAAVAAAQPKPVWRRWLPITAGLVVVVLLLAVGTRILNQGDKPIGAVAGGTGLAVLGFENKTGNQELDWMQTGLPEILVTDLSASTNANVISQRRVLDRLGRDENNPEATHSHQESVNAARELGASSTLSGAFYMVGDRIRIDARVEDIGTGKIIHSEKVQGTDAFALVDSLTQRIATALNVEEAQTGKTSVAELTTTSQDAYKYYHLGLDDFLNGRYDEAVTEFEKSISYDSTFALPYMRIGMARQFQGRPQEAAHYIAQAKQYESRLSNYDRNLLDIYADLWLNQQFDQAMTKLETLVGNYPNDKEAKSLLAVLYGELSNDTTQAFKLLNEVLDQDPGFRMALNWYSDICRRLGEYDRSIEYTKRILKYHPESYDAQTQLARLYTNVSQLDSAVVAYQRVLDDHPGDAAVLANLFRIEILRRNFDKAESYLDDIAAEHGDDPYEMMDYYANKAGLVMWHGKFRTAIDLLRKSLDKALTTGDSTLILSHSNTLSTYFKRFDMTDSALHYIDLSGKYATGIAKLNYPVMLVNTAPELADSARPMFEEAARTFRARVPSELWGLIDGLESVFNGSIDSDTEMVIKGLRQIVASNASNSSSNSRELGEELIKHGDYEEGIKIILAYTSGPEETASGYQFPHCQYLLGLGYQGLGDTEAAIRAYKEMLKYWGKPDMELKEIADARKRLKELETNS